MIKKKTPQQHYRISHCDVHHNYVAHHRNDSTRPIEPDPRIPPYQAVSSATSPFPEHQSMSAPFRYYWSLQPLLSVIKLVHDIIAHTHHITTTVYRHTSLRCPSGIQASYRLSWNSGIGGISGQTYTYPMFQACRTCGPVLLHR